MEIKFEINDEVFEKTFKSGLDDISYDQKKEILLKGLETYMTSSNCEQEFKKLFFESTYYGNSKNLSMMGSKIVGEALANDEDFKKMLTETIHQIFVDQGPAILINSLKEIFLEGIVSSGAFYNAISNTLKCEVNSTINDILRDHNLT